MSGEFRSHARKQAEHLIGARAIPGEVRLVRYVLPDGSFIGGEVLQQHWTGSGGSVWLDAPIVRAMDDERPLMNDEARK